MYTISMLIGFLAGCYSLWLIGMAAIWLLKAIFSVETAKKGAALASKEAAKHIIKNLMK